MMYIEWVCGAIWSGAAGSAPLALSLFPADAFSTVPVGLPPRAFYSRMRYNGKKKSKNWKRRPAGCATALSCRIFAKPLPLREESISRLGQLPKWARSGGTCRKSTRSAGLLKRPIRRPQTQAKREADLPAFVTVPPAKETGIRGIEAATAAFPIPIVAPTAAAANQTTSEVRDSSPRGSDLQLKSAITPESSSLPSKPGRRPHDATNTGQQSMVQEAAKLTIESAELTRAKAGNDCGSQIGSSQQRPASWRTKEEEQFSWRGS